MARYKTSHKTFLPRRLTRNRLRGYPRRSHKRLEIFGPVLLVEGELPELYKSLLEGLIRDLNPIGTAEFVVVEKLATNLWRQHRLIEAEAAEIGEATFTKTMAPGEAMHKEAWDAIRQGDQILRNQLNPILIRHAVTYLKDCRDLLEKNGFRPNENPWRLRELYGFAQGKFAPAGLFEEYMRLSLLANDAEKIKRSGVTVNEMKKAMLAALDKEIKSLAAC
jgi:hypothetical protein